MNGLPYDPLLVAIGAPLLVALLIALGLPKRWVTKLAYAGFVVPALMASCQAWWQFAVGGQGGATKATPS